MQRQEVLLNKTVVVDYSLQPELQEKFSGVNIILSNSSLKGQVPVCLEDFELLDGRENLALGLHPILKKSNLNMEFGSFMDYHMASTIAKSANEGKIELSEAWRANKLPGLGSRFLRGNEVYFPVLYKNGVWKVDLIEITAGLEGSYKVAFLSTAKTHRRLKEEA